MTLLLHELRMNRKSLVIWTVCVGFACFGCLLLFDGLQASMEEMAQTYAQMGTFSAVLGMDRMNIGTVEGFYAAEVALMFAVGGAMFAAMTGAAMVSKEEEGHTSEFLNTLPLGRGYIIGWKYAAMAALIVLFQLLCLLWILAGFGAAGELPPWKEFALYHSAQLLMQLEVGSLCFLMSALCHKKQIGAALGFAVFLYMMELMCRIVPDIEGLKYVTPYYFSNAVDIFSGGRIDTGMLMVSVGVTAACALAAFAVYRRRDLRA